MVAKKTYQKIVFALLVLILVIPLTVQAAPSEPTNLTQEEINQKLKEIGDKYKVGEFLSDEDADFVRRYALKPQDPGTITPFKTGNFEGFYGAVELTGYVSVDIGIINNSIQGNIITRDSNKTYHKSMGSIVELRAFGVFGEGGTKIGLVYSRDYQNIQDNVNYVKNSFSDNFVASVAYWTVDVRGFVDGSTFSASTID